MELVILGSGVCVPNKGRSPAGYLLKTDDSLLLLDSGSGTMRQIEKAGYDFMKITTLIYSHTHPDHVSDLIPILQGMVLQSESFGPERSDPLLIYGPRGFEALYRTLRDLFLSDPEPYPVLIRELYEHTLQMGNLMLTSKPVLHSSHLTCLGYRIECQGKTIAYSGDSGMCETLVELCRNVDLAILDCSYPKGYPSGSHLGVLGCGEVAE
ncbi:MAG: ribonuclease Z, partial [Candidatus Tectomicrobia bacterium]|nr:ribonuclease Z [Candidatus Tectomicrobia bacterium]